MKIICDFSVFYLDETLPKDSIVIECGNALLQKSYKLKIFNTINFSKSMKYNPMAYIHSEKDILKLVTTLMANTKGEGTGGDPFWEKSEKLLYTALIAYLHYEAPAEEQNFATLLQLLNAMEVREDDEEYQNPVDLLFEELSKAGNANRIGPLVRPTIWSWASRAGSSNRISRPSSPTPRAAMCCGRKASYRTRTAGWS